MCPLFICDLEGCIYDVEDTYILILNPSFNIFTIKRLLATHKDQIRLLKSIPCINQINKYLGFSIYHSP
jgi:hypothetical protein